MMTNEALHQLYLLRLVESIAEEEAADAPTGQRTKDLFAGLNQFDDARGSIMYLAIYAARAHMTRPDWRESLAEMISRAETDAVIAEAEAAAGLPPAEPEP
jgi:hypothetical protein